jgi:hypothetical protein
MVFPSKKGYNKYFPLFLIAWGNALYATTASHRPIAPIATSPEADLHAGLLASRKVSLHLAPHRVPSVAENSQTIPIQAKTPTALDPKAHEIQRGLFSNTNEFLRLHS